MLIHSEAKGETKQTRTPQKIKKLDNMFHLDNNDLIGAILTAVMQQKEKKLDIQHTLILGRVIF
jgi:hypothetical protein